VCVLGDLPDQGLAVGLGHVVAGLDPALVGKEGGEGDRIMGSVVLLGRLLPVGAEVVAVHAAHRTSAMTLFCNAADAV
jgi:hypothetical protein